MSARSEYRPEIDGLRALAVLPVVLFHMNSGWLKGGFLGVDVFFVISGFLITSIILRECAAGTFSFRAFWVRRVRRILPVLIAMVLVCVVVTQLLVFRGEQPAMGFQGVAALLSFANIAMWRMTGNYWGQQAESSPFLHTWSLSVEEQFYFFFPAMLVLVLRYKPQWLMKFSLALMGVGLAVFLLGAHYNPNAAFFLLPTRAWEMGAGCFLAAWVARPAGKLVPSWRTSCASVVGVLMVAASYAFVSGEAGVSASFVLPVIGAVLVIAFGQSGPVHWLLSRAPVVFIGKISYSLYIWHWPVLVFAKHTLPHHWALDVLLMLALTLGSYCWVEKPARSSKRAMLPIGFGFATALACAVLLASSSGVYEARGFSTMVYKGSQYETNPHPFSIPESKQLLYGVVVPEREKAHAEAYREGGIVKRYGSETPTVMVMGDSHAEMWSSTIDALCKEWGVSVSFNAMAGIRPFIQWPVDKDQKIRFLSSEEKYLYDVKRLESIEQAKPQVVVFVARWESYTMDEVRGLFQFLEQHVQHVILIEQPPALAVNRVNITQYLCFKGFVPKAGEPQYLPQGDPQHHEKGRQLIQTIAAEFKNVTLVPVCDLYAGPNHKVRVLDNQDVLYVDGDHLSESGAARAREHIKKSIQPLLGIGITASARSATDPPRAPSDARIHRTGTAAAAPSQAVAKAR